MKNVIIADICCLCYGADRSIKQTYEALENNSNVVLYKEILHNKNVMRDLMDKGARVVEDLRDIKDNDLVVIRAHGETKDLFDYLKNNNINYIDCTCPNVKAIEMLVHNKSSLGFKIIIIGKHGFDGKPMHPEVKGTMGWCDSPILIEDESEIYNIDLSYDKYFLVVQTTFAKDKAEEFINIISNLMKDNNKTFEYKNTICNAQKQINLSAEALSKSVDLMIVVGGKNSNNSRELYNNVSRFVPAVFVEDLDSLNLLINDNFFDKYQNIGITAGASTMRSDVEKIKLLLESI